MAAQTVNKPDIASTLTQRWEQVAQKFSALADAIPGDKFNDAPVPGLRTPAAVARHVAFWNRYVADSLAGRPVDDSANELSAAQYPDKQTVLKELQRTSADAASALRKQNSPLASSTAELITSFIEHTSEHYGQLVVYARMMGTVPPASRT